MDIRISYQFDGVKSRGNALILVLIFCTLIGILAHTAMSSAIIQLKMVNNFKLKLQIQEKLSSELSLAEEQLANSAILPHLSNVVFVQFVPDTLHFGERLGVNYYKIFLNKSDDIGGNGDLVTTYAVRSIPPKKYLDHSVNFKENIVEIFLNESFIAFIDMRSFKVINKIVFPTVMSNPIFTVIDAASKGFADAIYINDGNETLWKIDLQGDPKSWRISYAYSVGKMLGSPLIGRHPSGDGILIYLLIQEHQTKTNRIQVLWEQPDKQPTQFFSLADNFLPSQLLLRHSRLLAISSNGNTCHINVYHAFNGKFVIKRAINYFLPRKDLSALITLEVMMKKPLEEESVIKVNLGKETAYCQMELDYPFLGRRTWEEKHPRLPQALV